MDKTRAKRLENRCKLKNYGTFHAESGRIKADLKFSVQSCGIEGCSGSDWYIAHFNFYTEPVWDGDKEGFSTKVCYSFNSFGELFGRIKIAEEGIEEILAPPNGDNWKNSREVIKCILNLEDQTKHIPVQRREAYEQKEKADERRYQKKRLFNRICG